MNPLLIPLYSIFILLIAIGVIQFFLLPRNRANRYLGITILLIGIGIFQSLYLLQPQSERINMLLLLPLNLIFFPYFFSMRYMDSFAQKELFPAGFVSAVKYIAVVEIAVHLLPLGVILFTGEYSRPILDFLFNIRKIIYLLFLLFTFWGLRKGSANLKRITVRDGLDRNIYFGVRLFMLMTVVVSVLVAISILIPMVATHVQRLVFYIPQIVIGLFFIGWGTYNMVLNRRITQELIDDCRDTRQAKNPIFATLVTLLEEEKIYRNANLRISDVAERLSISPNYLSRIINETSEEGFNDLVNRYRVTEVIGKIKNREYQNQTLLGLALQAGFSSKSTFQSAFKKMTGKTPSEFKMESEKV